ncbi:uncharacterized protein PHACADRAFT_166716 [Phanerochaete carnosa HHB-10118-sp]|uniref:F-box domain-containing protein n=1 Tax=Phanerochaete carnosa (strain HHB-10118-sp) TaxID=650164 RepID=K5VU85_PHACS|nr:uncharacterized protein PHACADRAFT_166716 [Phanerochaete carnosa HHB-10118-sp]EKM50144.1 hypothetical protein PHACADRAFT_166716 [Phanerochaete carnosa HHB-10118-sp]
MYYPTPNPCADLAEYPHAFVCSEANKEEWLQLQSERKRLESELTEVSRRMNSFTYPCRIPVELLAEVFAYVGAYRPGQHTTDAIIQVSHVCHHWRVVANPIRMIYPNFWPGRKPEYQCMILQRSEDCSLYVSGNVRRCGDSEFGLVFDELRRIYSLEFPSTPRASAIAWLASQPSHFLSAPRLVFLSEASPNWPTDYTDDWDDDDFESRSLIPILAMPRLRHIELGEFDDNALDSLTLMCRELDLEELEDSTHDISKFLAVLGRAPLLESFRIYGGVWHAAPRTSRNIPMPKLEQIVLERVQLETWGPFLHDITAPNLSAARIMGVAVSSANSSVPHHLAELLTAATTVVSMATAAWRRGAESSFELGITQTSENMWLLGSASSCIAEPLTDAFYRRWNNSKNAFHVFLPDALGMSLLRNSLAGPEIQHLVICNPGYAWDVTGCSRVLGTLNPNIEEVTFSNVNLDLIVALLSQDPPPLSKLRTLHLYMCTRALYSESLEPMDAVSQDQLIEMQLTSRVRSRSLSNFLVMVRQRRALGMPVQRLSFFRCQWQWSSEEEAAFLAVIPDFSVGCFEPVNE